MKKKKIEGIEHSIVKIHDELISFFLRIIIASSSSGRSVIRNFYLTTIRVRETMIENILASDPLKQKRLHNNIIKLRSSGVFDDIKRF